MIPTTWNSRYVNRAMHSLSEAMLLAAMDTSSLIPWYLHDQLSVEIDQAARIASLFPLGMVCATFGGGFMYDALGPHLRANTLCGLGVCSLTALQVVMVGPKINQAKPATCTAFPKGT